MLVAILAATRTTCLVRGVGAALVKNNRVIASGYNGAPPKVTSCKDTGECYYKRVAHTEWSHNGGDFDTLCEMHKYQCVAVHAEANAVAQCLQTGVSSVGSVLYVTNFPCPKCVRDVIISGGIVEVVVWKEYLSNFLLTTDEKRESERLLEEVGIPFRYLELTDERIKEIRTLMLSVGERTEYKFKP